MDRDFYSISYHVTIVIVGHLMIIFTTKVTPHSTIILDYYIMQYALASSSAQLPLGLYQHSLQSIQRKLALQQRPECFWYFFFFSWVSVTIITQMGYTQTPLCLGTLGPGTARILEMSTSQKEQSEA